MEGILPPPGIRGALRLGAVAAHQGATAGTLGHVEKLENGVSRPLEFRDHNHSNLGLRDMINSRAHGIVQREACVCGGMMKAKKTRRWPSRPSLAGVSS